MNNEIPKSHQKCLLKMLYRLNELFQKHNIKYFIDGGTLLGAVRNKGLIPWDDDIDLGVLHKEWHHLPEILKELSDDEYKLNYQIEPTIIKVFVPGMWVKNTKTNNIIGTPTIDIFKWKKSNGRIELEDIKHRQAYKNCYYLVEEMSPFTIYDFNGILVTGAKNPIPYLYRYYGNDCLEVVKMDIRDQDNIRIKTDQKIIS